MISNSDISFLLIAMESNVVNYEYINSWIEDLLKNDIEIPLELYEIPFLKDDKEIQCKLIIENLVRWDIDVDVIPKVLKIIKDRLFKRELELLEAIECCYRLLLTKRVIVPEELIYRIMYFSDGYDLAKNGTYGEVEDIRKEFMLWLDINCEV